VLALDPENKCLEHLKADSFHQDFWPLVLHSAGFSLFSSQVNPQRLNTKRASRSWTRW
jgi:hypothetical protein